MSKNQHIFIIKIAIILCFFCVFIDSSSRAQQRTELDIWSPKKVDWWVSKTPNQKTKEEICEIHWLYDSGLDLVFVSGENGVGSTSLHARYYFSVELRNNEDGNKIPLNVTPSKIYEAFAVVDGVEHSLSVYGADKKNAIVLLSGDLSNVDYLKKTDRLYLELDGVSYNFPLENSEENFSVFQECEGNLAQSDNPPTVSSEHKGLDINPNPVLQEPLPELELFEHGLIDVESLDVTLSNDSEPLLSSETPKPPDADLRPSSKQSDKLLDQMKYMNATDSSDPTGGMSPQFEYNERNSQITNNLMKKLVLLEKEKEELRMRLLGIKEDRVISKIVACEPQKPTTSEMDLNETVLQKFELTINSLRAENELLKESLSDDEISSDTDISSQEIAGLKQQIKKLSERNSQMQEDIFNYQDQLEKESNITEAVDLDDENTLETENSEKKIPTQNGANNQLEVDVMNDGLIEKTE